MAITSSDINNQYFSLDRKGYDVDEVDVFLEHMAQEVDSFNSQIDKLKQDLQAATEACKNIGDKDEFERKLNVKDEEIKALKDKLIEAGKDDGAIAQALIVAQRSADNILADAKKEKEKIVKEAHGQAQKIIAKADEEKRGINRIIDELQAKSDESREEYKKILNKFISDSEKRLEDLQKTPVFGKAGGSKHSKKSSLKSREATTSFSAAITSVAPAGSTQAAVAPQARPTTEKDMSGFGEASVDLSMDLD
ncbi:MAG: DivIVA domain-containing protein [Eggerthellaceae bacterium]|nr:DivIVA domain-containing protein [Eggerthellaceae bacterium]